MWSDDGSGDDDDATGFAGADAEEQDFKVNKGYAARFEKRKKAQELAKRREMELEKNRQAEERKAEERKAKAMQAAAAAQAKQAPAAGQ